MDYAENAFNVPVVAYSGEKDPQKAAADNIESALKGFKEPLRFTHLVAPGLEHQMPPEWQAKAEAEYRKYAGPRPGGPGAGAVRDVHRRGTTTSATGTSRRWTGTTRRPSWTRTGRRTGFDCHDDERPRP